MVSSSAMMSLDATVVPRSQQLLLPVNKEFRLKAEKKTENCKLVADVQTQLN